MLTLDVAGLALPVSRLLIALAAAVTLVTAALVGRRERSEVGDIVWRMLLVGVLAARAAFVIHYFDAYRGEPLGMLDIRDGGFHPLFGVLAGLLVGTWSAARRPSLRRPLVIAVSAGALTWGGVTGALAWLNAQSRALPQTTLQTLNGERTSLPDVSDKPLVVNLWATWCPPCRREMPVLGRAQARRPDVAFAFVNQGEAAATIEDYLEQESLALSHVLRDPARAIGREAGSTALPTTLFYNARGKLVDTHLGELSKATLRSGLSRITDSSAP